MTAVTTEQRSTMKVIVTFPAAARPFRDDDVDPSETVGSLKSRALAAFGLTEGGTSDGNQVSYTLYYDKTPLEDPDQPIGSLSDRARPLQLKLSQQITQG